RLSEEENRLLFAVKLPGQREGRRVGELVRLIDVGPTLLDFARRGPLPNADGVSLMPLLNGGGAWSPQRLFAETGYTHASPAAFDREHLALAPRTFSAYRVLEGGVVEMTSEAHAAILREKDFGAYDG